MVVAVSRLKVTGFTHAASHYPWNLLWLGERMFADDAEHVHAVSLWDAPATTDLQRIRVGLSREPSNPADRNAIRVKIPELIEGGFHPWVGYVKSDMAAVCAPRLDAGIKPTVWVAAIPVGHRDDLSHPGLELYANWPD